MENFKLCENGLKTFETCKHNSLGGTMTSIDGRLGFGWGIN